MGCIFRFALEAVFRLAVLFLVMGTLSAQDTPANPDLSRFHQLGGPEDWSTSRVIYTRNGSLEDMMKMRDDPRLLHSLLQHYFREHRGQLATQAAAGSNDHQALADGDRWDENNFNGDIFRTDHPEFFPPPIGPTPFRHPLPPASKRTKVDWTVSLGPTGGVAAGESPAVYTYNYAVPSCSTLTASPPVVGDFIVYTINATPSAGTPGQANLVGLTNLYTTGAGNGFCTGTTPQFLFAYSIGSGGSALSPVLSRDGSRIAWIENRTALTSYLHITIWSANDGVSATFPIAPTGTFSNGVCTPAGSSCDYNLEYSALVNLGCTIAFTAGDGHSELYVDYASDAGFIGANNGLLYHIKNIFSTTTAPAIDFCIPVNTLFETTPSAALSGPVYDPQINEVFVTDSEKIYGFNVNASALIPNFSLAASYSYGNSGSNYNYQTGPGPLLDMYNDYLYVFSTYDKAGKTSVTQLPTSLASAVAVELGPKSTNPNPYLFYGAFDNNYYKYGPKSALSTLYSCGTDSTTTTAQDLFAISFNASSGLANTTPAMSYNANVNPGGANGICSPITEFYDGTNDRVFVGIGEQGASTGANVVTMWDVNTQLTNTSANGKMPTYAAEATNYTGGTSGISADNAATTVAQAESIYFSTEQIGPAPTAVTATGFNVIGIYTAGSKYSSSGGLDDDGNSYASNLLGSSATWNGTTFTFGTTNAADVWANTTITLPSGSYNTLEILAAAVNGNQTGQTFTVNYTDNTTTTFTQSLSDWYYGPQYYPNESSAVVTSYENSSTGGERVHETYIYGYSFGINPNKTVKSLTLPANRNVVVLAAAVATNCGGADYCAVKLTQSALQ
jgi:hypothetical protein